MTELLRRLRSGAPLAATSAAATLATFGTALALQQALRFSDSVLVLAVVLAVTLGRRQPGRSTNTRLFALVALPLASLGATEVGTQVSERPNLGDALFVLAVSACIWVRRFRGPIARLGSMAALPLIAILIAPTAAAGSSSSLSSSSSSSRWSAAIVALIALAWVTACFALAERRGWLPADTDAADERKRRPRPAEVDKMALRMLASLALAFALGRWLYGAHWPWLVITAFVVCSGGVEHADVFRRGTQRLIGAGLGTLGATLLTVGVPTGSPWSIVGIFAVLAVAAWLRPINYAFWACGVTSIIALLYGFYGERGTSLLVDRLEEIALGAVLAVALSWLVSLLPDYGKGANPLQDATSRVLAYVNRRHGLDYRLVGTLPPGAFLVQDKQSEAVLHWSRDTAAHLPAADVLASGTTPKGYPYSLLPSTPPS